MTKAILILSGLLISFDASAPMQWYEDCGAVHWTNYCGQYNYNYQGKTTNEMSTK